MKVWHLFAIGALIWIAGGFAAGAGFYVAKALLP